MKNTSGLYKNYDYFLQATRYKVKHGSKDGQKVKQKDLAHAIGCSTVHLSGILSAKKTRKASIGLQEKIAAYFDMPLISYLHFGRTLFEGKIPPEKEVAFADRQSFSGERRRYTDKDIVAQVSGLVNRLHEAEKEIHRLNSIIESIGEAVTIMGNDGTVIYQNSISRDLFAQNFVGKNYLEAIDVSRTTFVEGESSAVDRCFESGISETSISWAGKKCISGTASPLMDSSGNIAGVIFVAKDITQRQKLIDANQALVYQLSEALEKFEQGVCLFDTDGNIVFFNSIYRKLLQNVPDSALKSIATLKEFLAGSKGLVDFDKLMELAQEVRQTQTAANIEIIVKSTGDKYLYGMEPIITSQGVFQGYMTTTTPLTATDKE